MDDMKDSGIPWLGEIPAEWDIMKTLYVLDTPITDGPHETPVLYDDGIPFISAEAIADGYINFDAKRGYISRQYYDECCKKYKPQKLDIYMVKSGATTGKVAIVETNKVFTIWSPLAVFRANVEKILPYYLFYFIQSDAYLKQVSTNWSYGTQQNIGMRVLERLKVCVPSLMEQQRIVDFLDEKCGEIDGIVMKIQQEMETLKQYKQSVISEAVTKGIRPNVPMKDSHVEWIKKIPKTWEISKFKYLCQIKSNLVTPEQYKELPQISPDNIEKDSGKLLTYCTVEESGIISGNHLFTEGQILYSKIRPNLNKVTIAPFDGLCSADMYPIETKNPKFVLYMMLSKYFVDQVSIIIRDRVKMPKINQEELGRIRIAVPPLEEQREIAAYLDQKCAAIDAIISSKEEQLQTLASYKKSLIYEYVTGKKRVPTA